MLSLPLPFSSPFLCAPSLFIPPTFSFSSSQNEPPQSLQPSVTLSWTSPFFAALLPCPPSLSPPSLFFCPSSQNEPPQSRQPSVPIFAFDSLVTPTVNQKNTFYYI